MAIKEILQLGNPGLYEKSAPVDDILTKETRSLIVDLDDTLTAFKQSHGYGRGIAAPQIGILKRVIRISMSQPGFDGALINPEIVHESGKKIERWDSCFSFPNLLVKVQRSVEIRIEYFNKHGDRMRLDADGDLAELLQHEIDHLAGILAVDRAISPRSFMTREEWIRQGQPAA